MPEQRLPELFKDVSWGAFQVAPGPPVTPVPTVDPLASLNATASILSWVCKPSPGGVSIEVSIISVTVQLAQLVARVMGSVTKPVTVRVKVPPKPSLAVTVVSALAGLLPSRRNTVRKASLQYRNFFNIQSPWTLIHSSP